MVFSEIQHGGFAKKDTVSRGASVGYFAKKKTTEISSQRPDKHDQVTKSRKRQKKEKKIILQIARCEPGPTSALDHSTITVKHTGRVKIKLESMVLGMQNKVLWYHISVPLRESLGRTHAQYRF